MNEMNDTMEMNQNVLLQNENSVLDALLDAADYADEQENWRIIEVGNKKPFSFKVHALSEEDIEQCRKDATVMVKNPLGKRLPKVEGDTDIVKLRSLKLFRATVPEDQKRLWDNPTLKSKLGVMLPTDVIDVVLKAGQKDAILSVIDELSGFDSDDDIKTEAYLKN